MASATNPFRTWWIIFRDGFRSMTLGKTLWAIALIKLFIMFGILKVFFFPNVLNRNFDSDTEKSDFVRNELIIKSK